jgi:hypothetical protein
VKVPLALTTTDPFVVDLGPVNARESPSVSVADTEPVTTPVAVLGLPTVTLPLIGATFDGVTGTLLTLAAVTAPRPSLMLTMKLSTSAPAVAAAACLAESVGV